MGTPVPDEYPELEDGKFYRCGVDCYQDETPATDCSQAYLISAQCCLTGARIKAWLAGGGECAFDDELMFVTGFSAQRLVFVHGPYDDIGPCQDDI